MLHQCYFTAWHQICLIAAGFITAILFVWLQSEQRSYYETLKANKKNEGRLLNIRTSVTLAGFWLSAGILSALLAFGLTIIDWLSPCHTGLMRQWAFGFLLSAFNITLIAVGKSILLDYCKILLFEKKEGVEEPLDYGIINTTERKLRRACLWGAMCTALLIVVFFSQLLVAMPNHWLWFILGSFIIPISIMLSILWGIRKKKI